MVYGSVEFDTVFAHAPDAVGKSIHFLWRDWDTLTTLCLLLFMGAMGKSAQFLLHTWLPDAMEGPTPVSALIHAATMVTAGVFLVARMSPLFELAPVARDVVVLVGGITAFFAASVGLVQNDIKRVIAYSTCSQLGYMFVAMGVGAYGVGIFHLFTHAFFKALLFLGSGSVIHAVHSNDIRKMGGLRKKMPITGLTFLVGCIAIAGVPPLAGFFSKDEILLALKEAHQMPLYILASTVAFLTAFYMFRLYFLTFEGSEPAHGHPHESPATMTIPLVVLALLSISAGWTSLNKDGHAFGDYIHFSRAANVEADWKKAQSIAAAQPEAQGDFQLATAAWASRAAEGPAATSAQAPLATQAEAKVEGKAEGHESHAFQWEAGIWIPATLIGLAGILLAFLVYRLKVIDPAKVAAGLGPIYTVVYNKYYIDEFYRWMMDHVYYAISGAIAWFDRHVVDGVMNGLAWAMQFLGQGIRKAQTGRVQAYAMGMLGGLLALVFLAFKLVGR
jgi:NADH-quinone oxidoreductase subunit L